MDQGIDFTDLVGIEKQLRKATNALHDMAENVAKARQVKEFASERRKNLLARFMAPMMSDRSAATAEAVGRANPDYMLQLKGLENQYLDAERALAKWDATKATFEAARSLLSLGKEQIRQIS